MKTFFNRCLIGIAAVTGQAAFASVLFDAKENCSPLLNSRHLYHACRMEPQAICASTGPVQDGTAALLVEHHLSLSFACQSPAKADADIRFVILDGDRLSGEVKVGETLDAKGLSPTGREHCFVVEWQAASTATLGNCALRLHQNEVRLEPGTAYQAQAQFGTLALSLAEIEENLSDWMLQNGPSSSDWSRSSPPPALVQAESSTPHLEQILSQIQLLRLKAEQATREIATWSADSATHTLDQSSGRRP